MKDDETLSSAPRDEARNGVVLPSTRSLPATDADEQGRPLERRPSERLVVEGISGRGGTVAMLARPATQDCTPARRRRGGSRRGGFDR